jgi:carbamoyltransferase
MIVLGINGFDGADEYFGKNLNRNGIDRYRVLGHDAGACIFVDGVLIAAAEEERFTRRKKESNFPINSINFCLKTAGITINDVDRFAFPWAFDQASFCAYAQGLFNSHVSAPAKLQHYEAQKKIFFEFGSPEISRNALLRHFGVSPEEGAIHFVPHHLAHLFSGYYVAGCPDAAFLISDGRGEGDASILGRISAGEVTVFNESRISLHDSLGFFYSKITRYLGFVPNVDEYKVMGLAPYGDRQRFAHAVDAFVSFLPNGRYHLHFENKAADNQEYYTFFDAHFMSSDDDARGAQWRADVAAFAQMIVERVTHHRLTYLKSQLSDPTLPLILDGGVALNCTNNLHVCQEHDFAKVFVSFAANDAGVCIGAAAHVCHLHGELQRHHVSPYQGPCFDSNEIYLALEKYSDAIQFTSLPDKELLDKTSRLLHAQGVVGWFQGRMEFGPRALGNRSILADPTYPSMKETLNKKVKHREEFRPFAPVVLMDEASSFFDLGTQSQALFMTSTFPAHPSTSTRIPAAVHVDGTSRVQSVTERENEPLAKLLRHYHRLFDIPCLINTSFNDNGEPIVCTPEDAIRCFLNTEIDALVLNTFWVTKK